MHFDRAAVAGGDLYLPLDLARSGIDEGDVRLVERGEAFHVGLPKGGVVNGGFAGGGCGEPCVGDDDAVTTARGMDVGSVGDGAFVIHAGTCDEGVAVAFAGLRGEHGGGGAVFVRGVVGETVEYGVVGDAFILRVNPDVLAGGGAEDA